MIRLFKLHACCPFPISEMWGNTMAAPDSNLRGGVNDPPALPPVVYVMVTVLPVLTNPQWNLFCQNHFLCISMLLCKYDFLQQKNTISHNTLVGVIQTYV